MKKTLISILLIQLLTNMNCLGQSFFQFQIDSTNYDIEFIREIKNKRVLDVNVSIYRTGNEKYFFARNDNVSDSLLSQISDISPEDKTFRYYIGSCNELRFPLNFCKKDSIELFQIEKNKKYIFQFTYNIDKPLPYNFLSFGISFNIRLLKENQIPNKEKGRKIKISIDDFINKSERNYISIPPKINSTLIKRRRIK